MIDILLATYNGAQFLEEQILSLFAQTEQDWKLIIRDDGSVDSTRSIIEKYSTQYPEKICILNDGRGRLGSTQSFAALMEFSKSGYIMFCDQDDVWLPGKIALTYRRLIELENLHPGIPLLVFTDLSTTDESLHITDPSFMASQKFFTEIIHDATKLLALNVVPGCTIMVNGISKKNVLPIPASNIVHDQWIAINIAHYGKIDFIPIPTVLYRQHGKNSIGSNQIGPAYFIRKMTNPVRQFRIYRNLIIHLKFKVNIFAFLYHKLHFMLKRLGLSMLPDK